MSGPPPPSPRRPLHERSNSQSNQPLAIRIVPYSPPRPRPSDQQDDDSSPPSSRSTSQLHSSNVSDARYSSSYHSSSHRGSTISTSSSSLGSPATTVRGDSVSGSIIAVASDRATSATSATTPTPVINSPSYSSHLQNVNAQPRPSQHDGERLAPQYLRPVSRRRNIIALNSDSKTFSLVPHRQSLSDRDSRSPRLSFNSTTSASSDPFTDEYASSSPLTTLPELDRSTVSPSPLTRSPSPTATVTPKASRTAGDHLPGDSSPWNYRLVGGLRKVPGTPSVQRVESDPEPSSDDTFLPRLVTTAASPPAIPPRAHKRSLESLQTASTASGDANWKVFNSSPPYQSNNDNIVAPSPSSDNSNYEFPTPSSDNPNYQILSTSSTPSENPNYQVLSHSSTPSPSILEQPSASDSDENYVVHAESSPAPSSSIIRVAKKRVRQEYSQESLLVQPLRPHKKPSSERLGFYKQISRESLRHATSIKSFHSILNQDATYTVLLSEPAAAYVQGGPQAFAGVLRDTPRPRSNTVSSSGSGSSPRPPMTQQEQPHQWSSQLSTVLSESEGESDLPSRSVSALSNHPRRGSGFLSTHSRNMLSVSSIDERSLSHSRSRSDPLERPQPAYGRNGHHEIRDQDEHGDGLTELNALQHRPSRSRLPGFLGGTPDRNLHSSSSSRANSFSSLSLPSWVRLYYGNGERRLLAPSSESMYSQYMEGGASASPFQSASGSPFHSASPSSEMFPSQIFNQRKRPHQPRHSGPHYQLEEAPSSVVESAGAVTPIYRPVRFIKKQTSSIWSPHLRHDHRPRRYSMWEPPAVAWSSGSGPFSRRNVQVVAFVLGFVFPFAWMIAAVLPLPRNPYHEKAVDIGASADVEAATPRRMKSLEELHYDGALWWRRLNRYMSFVGLLVIGAVIALVVLGVREGWGS